MEQLLAEIDCAFAAESLLNAVGEAPEPQLMKLCAECLREMSGNLTAYVAGIEHSNLFLDELIESIIQVSNNRDEPADILHEKAFAIIECIAVLSKEILLRKNRQEALPVQKDIMRYFEGCGHWTPGDGTLVTEYYYLRLPNSYRKH